MTLGAKLEVFLIFFDNFRDIAKTEKIARRRGESTKMEGPGGQEWHQNQKKTHRNLLQNLKRKIIPKWSQHGGKMESKWSQKGINKSMFFWIGFWKPLETLTGLRRGCDGAAGELRRGCGCHTFSSRPPRAAPYYQRLLYKNKQRALLKG